MPYIMLPVPDYDGTSWLLHLQRGTWPMLSIKSFTWQKGAKPVMMVEADI